jgi:hypothetical protein
VSQAQAFAVNPEGFATLGTRQAGHPGRVSDRPSFCNACEANASPSL